MEHWSGVQNGGIGGVGRRVFDVSCNGVMLLRGFDICREEGTAPLVKSFSHIEPTPQGKIEIYFTPAVNYPSARLRQFQSRECPDILREKPMSSEKEKRGQEPGTKRGHFYWGKEADISIELWQETRSKLDTAPNMGIVCEPGRGFLKSRR